jgi:chromosome segregation ATPase
MEWVETKTVIREVQQLYSREDDLRDIAEIQRMAWDLDVYFQNSKRSAREVMKEMLNRVTAKEMEITSGKPSTSEHNERLRAFQSQKGVLMQEINQYQAEIESSNESMRQLAEESSQLKEKITHYEEECAQQDNRTAYAVSLYSKITNINWDYSQPQGYLAGGKI